MFGRTPILEATALKRIKTTKGKLKKSDNKYRNKKEKRKRMMELIMIGFLILSMSLNVLTIAYFILYFDYFLLLKINGLLSAVLSGLAYISTLIGSFYVCAKLTDWSILSEEVFGKDTYIALILFFLFALQSIPAAAVYYLTRVKVTQEIHHVEK
jgi:cation transport ATPase